MNVKYAQSSFNLFYLRENVEAHPSKKRRRSAIDSSMLKNNSSIALWEPNVGERATFLKACGSLNQYQ